ncbi:adenine methyltransferase [Collimonas pratensis]|uniref:DNA adenine methylase n=1 Tax=Collimonas pratensis TaxID=279113 RepID=UPI00143DD2CE|nr:DNA adenine methylase [Collimonas pratensis]NKI69005.1 adenine methyltransferase [Collimonas pratensis]
MWEGEANVEFVEKDVREASLKPTEGRVKSLRPFAMQSLSRKGPVFADHNSIYSKEARPDDISFPSTRFYGSKRRQLTWLREEFKSLEGVTALDAFGGTGAVSHLLRDLGWETTYNDIFEFNIISARTLFSDSTHRLSEDTLLKFLNRVRPTEGFITATFEGLYFTTQENMWLDGFMACLPSELEKNRDLLLHCLFQACLKKRPFNLFHRANLNLRHSEMPVQFGNRSTWNKSFDTHILTTYREVQLAQTARAQSIQVTSGLCAGKIAPGFDLVYLDPPYFKRAKRNTETYLERYHFLEGLARYDEWPSLIDQNSSLRAIKRPYRLEWTNKQELLVNLQHMIKKHSGAKFALSYVADEEPTEEELFNLFRENFDRVRLSRRSFNRVLSKKRPFEILLIGQ